MADERLPPMTLRQGNLECTRVADSLTDGSSRLSHRLTEIVVKVIADGLHQRLSRPEVNYTEQFPQSLEVVGPQAPALISLGVQS